MSAQEIPSSHFYPFDNHSYDLNKVQKYLGTQDIFSNSDKNDCVQKICNFISEIWISIQRIYNYLCGDHEWYNNETAYRIVFHYFQNTPETTATNVLIQQIHNQLLTRRCPHLSNGRENYSYIDRLHEELLCIEDLSDSINGQNGEVSPISSPSQPLPIPVAEVSSSAGLSNNILEIRTPLQPLSEVVLEKVNQHPFEKVTEATIQNFVTRFLHPYISGQITQYDEDNNRPSMMTLLKKKIGEKYDLATVNLVNIERAAFWCYLKTSALGLYIYLPRTADYHERRSVELIEPLKPATDEVDETIEDRPKEYSHEFTMLIEALIPAIQIDFPGLIIQEDMLIELAEEAMNEVNQEREAAYAAAMNFTHPEDHDGSTNLPQGL